MNRSVAREEFALVTSQTDLIEIGVCRCVISNSMSFDTPLTNQVVSLPILVHRSTPALKFYTLLRLRRRVPATNQRTCL